MPIKWGIENQFFGAEQSEMRDAHKVISWLLPIFLGLILHAGRMRFGSDQAKLRILHENTMKRECFRTLRRLF